MDWPCVKNYVKQENSFSAVREQISSLAFGFYTHKNMQTLWQSPYSWVSTGQAMKFYPATSWLLQWERWWWWDGFWAHHQLGCCSSVNTAWLSYLPWWLMCEVSEALLWGCARGVPQLNHGTISLQDQLLSLSGSAQRLGCDRSVWHGVMVCPWAKLMGYRIHLLYKALMW